MVLLTGVASAQQTPYGFRLSKSFVDTTASYMVDSTSNAGLGSNSIVDIRAAGDSLIFFGTSGGLSVSPDLGQTFRVYIAEEVNLPRGSISAMGLNDSLIFVAGLSDTVVVGSGQLLGTGLAYSTDMGDTWTYLAQPQDPSGSTEIITFNWGDTTVEQLAITTPVSNTTWDLAYSLGTIWAASWSSGLRRYSISSGTWSVVPLPRDGDEIFSCDSIPDGYVLNPRDPIDSGNHNHKGFSVIAYDSLVWVGTAAGLNKGIVDSASGCIAWTHFTVQNSNLTGNWVVALYRQVLAAGGDRIWASSAIVDPGESLGLSYTDDGGETWKTTLRDIRVHNVSSFGDDVYAATERGLYKSPDGLNWARFSRAVDNLTGERIYAPQATGVMLDGRDTTLWVGTADGLARTTDAGVTWTIERSFISTQTAEEDRFYAYPNPFYLTGDALFPGSNVVRFQYHIEVVEIGLEARINIFDFAMDPVVELPFRSHDSSGDFSQAWNGRNGAGFRVANGVYYCRLKLGPLTFWTKVVVIK